MPFKSPEQRKAVMAMLAGAGAASIAGGAVAGGILAAGPAGRGARRLGTLAKSAAHKAKRAVQKKQIARKKKRTLKDIENAWFETFGGGKKAARSYRRGFRRK